MGYFSNGTEGQMFVERFCERCVNWRDLEDGRGPGCPVYDVHMFYAYEECDSGSNAEMILSTLIEHKIVEAVDEFGVPVNDCKMFLPRDAGAVIPGQLRLGDEG